MPDNLVLTLKNSDVYETSDLPEADQNRLQYEETTDSVETLHISANEAFGKFKGANLDSKNVDFSDRLRNSRRKGYIVWTGDENNDQPEETPVKKYQRLNCELRELLDQIAVAKKNRSSGLEEHTLEGVMSQAENLHKQLMGLRLEDVLGREVVDIMTDPQAATRKKLLAQLEQLKTPATVTKKSEGKTGENTSSFSYELFLKPQTSKLQQEALAANLESRLTTLEQAIGPSQENMSILSMETNRKNISEAVNVLAAKTALLDPNHLDHIEGRLAALQQKLSRDTKVSLESEEAKSQLDRLEEITTQSSSLYTSLPAVIDRLEVLQSLHCQGAEFSRSLVELESVQQQMIVELGNDSSLIKETQAKFEQNLENIQANFANLDKRIEALNNQK